MLDTGASDIDHSAGESYTYAKSYSTHVGDAVFNFSY